MIKVAVAGYSGRMGSAVVDAVSAADDMEVVCGIDPYATEQAFPTFTTIDEALAGAQFDVLVDFTQPDVVAKTLAVALPAGIDCVVGTTGMSQDIQGVVVVSDFAGDPAVREKLLAAVCTALDLSSARVCVTSRG